jgi:hypothetical protein
VFLEARHPLGHNLGHNSDDQPTSPFSSTVGEFSLVIRGQ